MSSLGNSYHKLQCGQVLLNHTAYWPLLYVPLPDWVENQAWDFPHPFCQIKQKSLLCQTDKNLLHLRFTVVSARSGLGDLLIGWTDQWTNQFH